MLNRSTRGTRVLTAAILLVLWNPDAGHAADPFYERLLQDGIRSHGRGDHSSAAKNLRLACFGLLDEPTVLAQGLTYLALAQAELGEDLAFAITFDRILEVEHRFQAFSLLELNADLRATFEAHLHRLISVDALGDSPAFRQVARRKHEEQIHAMAPAERRQSLERLVTAEPENPTWGLLLAELKLDSGDFEDVLTLSEQILARDPRLERALCLRGRAGMATGSCEQALADLESCQVPVDPAELMAARLRCLVRLGDWQNASILLAEVPPDKQRRAPFKQLAREVKKGLRTVAREAASSLEAAVQDETSPLPAPENPTPGSATAPSIGADSSEVDVATPETSSPAPVAEMPVPETSVAEVPVSETSFAEMPVPDVATDDPTTWPPELTAELERARQLLPGGSREQLDEAFATVRELADRYRQLTEPQHLAAEIAYRLSRWQEVVTFFQRGGLPGPPDRLFYLSVALYETGDRAQAMKTLERCLPSLEMTAFVRSYAGDILGAEYDPADREESGSLGARR